MNPKKINITISKLDLAKTEKFVDNRHCLIATALRRRGFKEVIVTPVSVETSEGMYRPVQSISCEALTKNGNYKKELIGQKFIFVGQKFIFVQE
jgi:hypothetical protein